eukprot:Skav223407  [mRNA]  locus=scaffold350:57259:76318:- [translate_table: standard]
MKVLLCQKGKKLWSKPLTGGEWRECPYSLHLDARRVKALELQGGRRYLFLFHDAPGGGIHSGLDTVLIYDLSRNEWLPPTPARAMAAGHQEEVHWQTMNGPRSCTAPLKAWVLEASMDYVARATQKSAILQVDSGDELLDFPQYPADYADTCGWLLDAEDWAAGPMAVTLPDDAAWGNGTWSMVIARGALEDKPELQVDMAPRIYLLEDDADLRLWVSRRIDDLNAGLQPPTFESQSLPVKHPWKQCFNRSIMTLAFRCIHAPVAYRTSMLTEEKGIGICSKGDTFFAKRVTANDGSLWLCNESKNLFLPLMHPKKKTEMFQEVHYTCTGTVQARSTPEISNTSEAWVKKGQSISALPVLWHPGWLIEAESKLYYPVNDPEMGDVIFKAFKAPKAPGDDVERGQVGQAFRVLGGL